MNDTVVVEEYPASLAEDADVVDPGVVGDLGTSVGKALALLGVFDSGAPTLGVSELARRVNLPKSTAFRLLTTLERSGFVERRGSGYCIGPRLFEMGNLAWHCRPRSLRDLALPYMVELLESTHQTVHLAILDGGDALYVEKLFEHGSVSCPSYVGGRVPARSSGIGKAMLAFAGEDTLEAVLSEPVARHTPYTRVVPRLFRNELDRVRHEGVAFDHEEIRLGLTCVGAPILRRGVAVAGLSLAGPSGRFDPERVAAQVRRAATGVGQLLGA